MQLCVMTRPAQIQKNNRVEDLLGLFKKIINLPIFNLKQQN